MKEAAVWLASMFGPFLTILGLWMIVYSENILKIFNIVRGSIAFFYFNSVLNLLIGFAILGHYNGWAWDPLIFVTLLGWALVIRGVIGLFVPQLLIAIVVRNSQFLKFFGAVPLIWGLALSWIGFIM